MRLYLIFLLITPAFAATPEPTLLDAAFRAMYNLQFDEAHHTLSEWSRLHPEDPMGPASEAAAYLYSEFDRLRILQSEYFTDDEKFKQRQRQEPDAALKRKFEAALEKSKDLAVRVLSRLPQDANALLATSMRCGLRADYYGLIDKKYMASLREAKNGRIACEKLLAIHPDFYDAYLAAGVENYMLSLKPAPVRWLLRLGGARTDKSEGIRNLRLTAEKGRYFRPYALLLLGVAALREGDKNRARQILQELSSEFPRNRLYAQELVRLKQSHP